ncbi:cysteine synthase [Rhodococcus sp. 27YEA15]|uniref:hypothetical protein n=1 Tax=Rhodococcus sp. 27YEA15 TaxID=3156259 RepID=UPI003C7C452C
MTATEASSDARRTITAGVSSATGHTPLIELTALFPEHDVRVMMKMEMLNPAGVRRTGPPSHW